MLQQGGGSALPARAVHDTVAAIVRGRGYARSVRSSTLDRFLEWLGELITRAFRGVPGVPHARQLTLALVFVVIGLVAARIVYATRLRGVADELEPRQRRRRGVAVDPVAEAERAAREGRYTDAAHFLYRALLQGLARRERVRLHPAKTSGDYARELRRAGSAAYAPFRDFGRRYDRIIYGVGTCDADGWAGLVRAAGPLLEREHAA